MSKFRGRQLETVLELTEREPGELAQFVREDEDGKFFEPSRALTRLEIIKHRRESDEEGTP